MSTNIPGFNVTGQPTVVVNAATGSTIDANIDEQYNPQSTATEGYGLGFDFLATDHNRTNIDITDASNAIHTSSGYNVVDSNSVSGHAETGQRNDTGGDQRLQDTPPERATEGQIYGEGLPWPSEIVANANNW